MRILYKSIHIINYEENKIIPREIPEHFNFYIEHVIDFIDTNTKTRQYRIDSQLTDVVKNIKGIISDNDLQLCYDEKSYNIVSKLLNTENERQSRIGSMDVKIKKGSVIQALLKDEEVDRYEYLIAKVNHTNFIDDSDFISRTGFSAKEQDISKTCLFEITKEDDILIDSASIYIDNRASYWANEFLELTEMRDDEINTKTVFKEVNAVLMRNVNKKSKNDYTVLRNSLIGYLKKERLVNYDNLIKDLFEGYSPLDDEKLNRDAMKNMVEKLEKLPQTKKFDLQFNSAPTAINSKIKKEYIVNQGIKIKIDDYIEDIKNIIHSEEEKDGSRYIKIKTNNEETFKAFE
ncbi:hypothetical protein [Clostridioides difficile]|uniref:hypothetical protein n=1 Tax=Clostridioides difficile TaxID=1496 RepID=UPI00097FDA4A|nr:hypothetical protein [Clostridioides difficile]MCU5872595.1 hypothetical protein [Clostridioides difficile]MCU5898917.1 hypothetical protein [Clostridioides difficile]MDV9591521.1 hypothetical protein [Clostridioides difficile]SJO60854.1 Uncharacterised protein [Clostridioides difficile]SJP48248.1 Uncharacterised protein [Clostridioides difficile]